MNRVSAQSNWLVVRPSVECLVLIFKIKQNKKPVYFEEKLSPQICDSAGGRGVPRLFFLIGILIFLLLRTPCKNLKPYDNPSWGFE